MYLKSIRVVGRRRRALQRACSISMFRTIASFVVLALCVTGGEPGQQEQQMEEEETARITDTVSDNPAVEEDNDDFNNMLLDSDVQYTDDGSDTVTFTAQYNTTYTWVDTLRAKWDFGDSSQSAETHHGECECDFFGFCICEVQHQHSYTDPGDYAGTLGIYTEDDQPLEGLQQTVMVHVDAVLSKVTIIGATDFKLPNKLFVEKGANLCTSVDPATAYRDALNYSWIVDMTPKLTNSTATCSTPLNKSIVPLDGNYEVTISVVNDRSTITQKMQVIAIDKEANISISTPRDNMIETGTRLTFGTVGGNPLWSLYEWSINGPNGHSSHTIMENTSATDNIIVKFNDTGVFNISVIVSNPISQVATSVEVKVKKAPKPFTPGKVVGVSLGGIVVLALVGVLLTGFVGTRFFMNKASVEVANFDFVMSPRGNSKNDNSPLRPLNRTLSGGGRSAFQDGMPSYNQGSVNGGGGGGSQSLWQKLKGFGSRRPKAFGGAQSAYDTL